MQSALDKVKRFVERNAMVGAGRGIVVAVSGGADSVALLDILQLVSEDKGPPLHVAHLNHKLRGIESDGDAEFVRRLAGRLGLPITVVEAEVGLAAEAGGLGIEEMAREMRYDFLVRVARKAGFDLIATGHTMSDQAETFLMRLTRGTGLRGLAAMRPVSPVPCFGGEAGRVGEGANAEQEATKQSSEGAAASPSPQASRSAVLIRPMLCLTREEVEEYCRDRDLEYRTDASNLETNYTRNRMRLEVLPALREINPRVVESLARAADIAAADQDALDQIACRMLDAARETSTKGSPDRADQDSGAQRREYSVAKLLEQPAGLTRRMIIEAINRQRPAADDRADRPTQIDSSHIAAVEALLAPESSGKRVTLPDGLSAWREFDRLVFTTGEPSPQEPGYKLQISAGKPIVEAGGLQITLEWESNERLEGALDRAKALKRLIGDDWMMAALDRTSLSSQLIVRPRRKGERALVVGQRKTKKLKKLMIDHRIPPSLRHLWPIVATADDRYVWSPGLPPALEFAASDETPGLAILRASGA